MRFVRENWQMANKKLYREDVLQLLFANSDSEGEYLPLEMTIGRLMIALLPVHLCMRNGAARARRECSQSKNK